RRGGVVQHGVVQLLLEVHVVADHEARTEGEPHVVQCPQPGLGGLLVQRDVPAAGGRQHREDRPGLVHLRRLELAVHVLAQLGGAGRIVRIYVGEQAFDDRVVPVEAVGQQRDDLRGDLAQHLALLGAERRGAPLPPAAEHAQDWSTVAHNPYACRREASCSIRSRAPEETVAFPLWCTSSMSFSALSRLYPKSFWNTHVT